MLVIASQGVAQVSEAGEDASSRDEEARAIYEAGVVAYNAGRFSEALRHFRGSYELSQRPALLYNIATAAERSRKDALALESYEAYLDAIPDTPLRERIETRISDLRSELERAESDAPSATEAQPVDVPVPSRTASDPPPTRSRVAPLVLLSAGAAIAAMGAVTLGMGLADKSKVESPSEGSRDWSSDGARPYQRGPKLLRTGFIALPLGLVAAAIGTVWVLKVRSSGTDPERFAIGVGPGSLSLRGRF